MNRQLLSKALSQLDEAYIAESIEYRSEKRSLSPERKPAMKSKRIVKRISALALAACLLLALGAASYAANLWGIKELFRTEFRQLPEAAEQYIQPQDLEGETGEDWSCRVSETLCDAGNIMVMVEISGGDQYIIAPTDSNPDDLMSSLGFEEDMTLGEYAAAQGKSLLLTGAALNLDGEITGGSQRFENISPSEMRILTRVIKAPSDSFSEATCQVYALEIDSGSPEKTYGVDDVRRVNIPLALNEAPPTETVTLYPETPDAIPGISIQSVTLTKTPLGISMHIAHTVTDQEQYYNVMKIDSDELTMGEGSIYDPTMCEGTVTDTLTLHFYDTDKQPIGDIVFKK